MSPDPPPISTVLELLTIVVEMPTAPPAPPTAPGQQRKTDSGVGYVTLKPGTGPEVKAGQTIVVHYTGTLKDGTVFDSTEGRDPAKFKVGTGEVINGWDDAIPGMKIGEKRKIYIPAHRGYGAQQMGKIPPNSTLVFDIEVVKVEPK